MSLPSIRSESDWASLVSILNAAGVLTIFTTVTQNSYSLDVFNSYNRALLYFFAGLLISIIGQIITKPERKNYNSRTIIKTPNGEVHMEDSDSDGYSFLGFFRGSCRFLGISLFGLAAIQSYGALNFSQDCVFASGPPFMLDNVLFDFPIKPPPLPQDTDC
ncbi:hypothetical protein [Fodinicurvata sp. EGI_FJ10296]|uniref:hypothetical protein n=1 Tax=Fodinicurvata sp. EGI_FJ10296 TaxID=3231908 RepID=UPI003455F6E8